MGSAARTGQILVGTEVLEVTQAAAGQCVLSVSQVYAGYALAGGVGDVSLTVVPSCNWTATSTAPWLTVTGVGPTSVNYAVAFNSSSTERVGALDIGGLRVVVYQAIRSDYTSCPAANPDDNVADDEELNRCLAQGGIVELRAGRKGYLLQGDPGNALEPALRITVNDTWLRGPTDTVYTSGLVPYPSLRPRIKAMVGIPPPASWRPTVRQM